MKRKISSFLVASLFCASLCPIQVFYAEPPKKALNLSSEKISENDQDDETENIENSSDQSENTVNTDNNSSVESGNKNISEKSNEPRVKFCFSNSSETSETPEKSDLKHNFDKKMEKSNSEHLCNKKCDKCEKTEKPKLESGFLLQRSSAVNNHDFTEKKSNYVLQTKPFSPSNQSENALPACGPHAKFLNKEGTVLSLGNDEIIFSSQSVHAFPTLLCNPDLSGSEFLYKERLFFHAPIKISGVSTSKLAKIDFEWLTVRCQRPVVFENLEISGFIDITAGANVTFKHCKIRNSKLRKQETAVHIFGGASGVFEDCIFDCNSNTCVCIENNLSAIFKNCEIKSAVAGFVLMAGANMEAHNCNFFDNIKWSIIANSDQRTGKILLKDCIFHDSKKVGAIFLRKVNNAEIVGCKFNNLPKTAIYAVESGLKVENCGFQNIGTGIDANNNTKLEVSNCNFDDVKYNGVIFKFSSGKLSGCSFSRIDGPAVCTCGKGSSPSIENCRISNVKSPCIAVINDSSPIFKDTSIIGNFDTETPVICCSDFSGSVFQNLNFAQQVGTVPSIVACNAAKVKISSCPIVPHCETFGEISFFAPSSKELLPEFVSEEVINYDSKINTNIKVISCQCGHPITKCPKCGNKDSDVFTFSGNKLICKNCGELTFLPDDKHCCEICKRNISSVTQCLPSYSFDDGVCSFCCDDKKKANIIFLPCGHKGACSDCAKKHLLEKATCPYCNKSATKFVYDFFSDKE